MCVVVSYPHGELMERAILATDGFSIEHPVRIGRHHLPGTLAIPTAVRGLVLFAHGSGSSHLSPRNQFAARQLYSAGLGTLLFDLLNAHEGHDRLKVFDIELLSSRLEEAILWVSNQAELRGLKLGLFGASTGAAAALVVAAHHPDQISAVVSRGGRPDLAEACLDKVRAPTLLIVGGYDDVVIELNQRACELLSCEKKLEIVPAATHLFPEPGALDQVAQLATDWFMTYLSG